MAGTILVTGGSGYIAGYLIRQLAAEGWTIHTTVRSLKREAEVRAALVVPEASLRFFAADLMEVQHRPNNRSHIAKDVNE